MKDLIQYQIEIAICMAAITLLYLLLWKKETNFVFKRFLLVSIPLFSLTIPLISLDINLQPEQDSATIQYITYLPNQLELVYAPITARTESITGWELAFWIFAIGAIIMLFRLIISYFKIWQLYRKSVLDTSGEYRLIEDPFQSFSFFNLVMINQSQARSNERDYIVAHEKAHSRQGHSFDVLWLEIIKMLHWFNPFIWFITRENRQNMEYLADQEVATKMQSIEHYQYAIVHHASNSGYRLLKTQFSKSNLKNRIIMMNQPNNHKVATWKILVILPAFAILFMSFSLNFGDLDISNKLERTLQAFESSTPNSEILGSNKKISASDFNAEQSSLQTYSSAETIQSRRPTKISTADTPENNKTASKYARESGIHSNETDNAIQIKSFNSTSWKTNAFNWGQLPSKSNLLNKVSYRLSFSNKLREQNQIGGTIKTESGDPIPGANVLIKGFTIGTITDLNGKFLLEFKPEHKEIVVSRVGYEIMTLDIISGKEYDITLVRDSEAPPPSGTTDDGLGISIKTKGKNIYDVDKKPLFILDGKEMENFDINSINPQNIESITVLKDTSAFKRYGEKARHGVIIIKSKNNTQEDRSYLRNEPGGKTENIAPTQLTRSFDPKNPPLVILDGTTIAYKDLQKLNVESIVLIEVLKDELAMREYGEKGKNGVIIINSKNNGENQDGLLIEYKEGMNALYRTIQKQIKYPLEARKSGLQGKVFISFNVTKDGNIEKIEASETRYTLLEEIVVVGYPTKENNQQTGDNDLSMLEDEVVRVLKEIDKITPLTKDGKPVDTRMTLPATFKLD